MKSLTWVKIGGKTYQTTCGRFQIINCSMTSPAKWVLFDKSRQDVNCPQYGWSEGCTSLENGKNRAERIVRSETKSAAV